MQTMSLDLASVRSQFKALSQTVGGRPLSYLDNAATTHRPERVLEAMDGFSRTDNSNVHRGVHILSQRATQDYEDARIAVASFIGATAESLVFTKGCTESLNLVAHSWGGANLKPGDVVLVSTMEHHSNLVPWQVAAEKAGARIEPIPVTDEIELDVEWLKNRMGPDVKAVCVKAVCNATGRVNPVTTICQIAAENGSVSVIDAAQALAHQKIDVKEWGADFVALTAHKAYGPMGIGALYAKPERLNDMSPYQTGGGMVRGVSFAKTNFADPPERFEAGTPNVAGAIGFAEATRFINETGVEAVSNHENALAQECRSALSAVPGVKVFATSGELAPVVSFVVEGAHPHDVGTVLDTFGVAVRAGHHCCMPLMARLGVAATSRASFAAYNTMDEVRALIEGVKEVRRLFA